MGNMLMKDEPPPKVVLVPPLFERDLRGRNRMAKSSYDFLFSKHARARLFGDYFADTRRAGLQIFLRPPEDNTVDVMVKLRARETEHAGVDGPPDRTIDGKVAFRWQWLGDDPNAFMDVALSTRNRGYARARICQFDPNTGIGVFASAPLFQAANEKVAKNAGVGVRYSTEDVSIGGVYPISGIMDSGGRFWAVARFGRVLTGCQYDGAAAGLPLPGLMPSIHSALRNGLSYAIAYGTGGRSGRSALEPAFDIGLELQNNKRLIASYFHHLVLTRAVKNPFEETGVVGITNYVDIGFEIAQNVQSDEPDPSVALAGSWQANKNLLVKAKVATSGIGAVVAFKSWWQPSFTFALSAGYDVVKASKGFFGLMLRVENFGGIRYERGETRLMAPAATKQTRVFVPAREAEGGSRPMMPAEDDAEHTLGKRVVL
eukprot:jgi/Chlat1/8851/Chrsp91S08180